MRFMLAAATLCGPAVTYAASIPPAPANPMQAQTALTFSVKSRCPDLRDNDEGSKAVIVFWLPRDGKPTQITLKASSGSEELDTAAISCVSKLRFAAATRLGDGEPIDSWQQFALRWVERAATAPAAAPMPATARAIESSAPTDSATVKVCVDDQGKLEQNPVILQSSGVTAVDQAAVKIAAAGAPYYHPDASSRTPATSRCAQLTIKFDAK